MGIMRSGILGNLRGKVAGVVGSQWKDVNYLREFVKPANPNSAAQQVQRSLMSGSVAFAKVLVGPVFNAYTDKFIKSMSGFNFFIKQNITRFVASPVFVDMVLSEGKLSSISDLAGVYDTATGSCALSWSTNYGNNGSPTDLVFTIGYNEDTGLFYFVPDEATRSTGSDTLQFVAGLTAADLTVYSVTSKYIGSVLNLISNSDSATCTAV